MADFQAILKDAIANEGCDDDTIAYMAGKTRKMVRRIRNHFPGMLEEESSALDEALLIELIGPFLSELEVDVSQVCAKIAARLSQENGNLSSSTATSTPSRPNTTNGEPLIRKPFNAGSFLNDAQSGFIDPYLGLQKVNVNFNAQIPIAEAMKLQAALQKEREKQLRLMREWEKTKLPLPKPLKQHGDKERQKVTDIIVNSFSVSVAGRELLKDASLKIVIGRKYGLIGRNGIGKSTFICALVRHELPGIPKDLTIGCVEQEISEEDLNERAIDAVLSVDKERSDLLEDEKKILEKPQTDENGKLLAKIYSRLEEIDAHAAESEGASILAGLGFSVEMQKMKIRELSGGWRMRVALARALFSTPDILCLDEPTNHLDLHAVAWLTDHLQSWKTTCIIVSHARSFLNDVCTDIMDFRDQKLKYYRGDYDTYERVKTEADRLQQRQFEAQQMKREHVQKFIDRFRAKAARAALVQSRIKALEKLPNLEAVSQDPALSFKFSVPEELPTPVLQLDEAWFSYRALKDRAPAPDSDDWILKNVDLSVDLQSRIAICGVNGCGKSTLLKLLSGANDPQRGFCRRANKLRVGIFSQYHVEQLDLTLNSVQQIQVKFPESNMKDEEVRNYLGRFGISGLLALEPLYVLSGGQKSRVAIALLAFTNPHILILDEPTNHLDLDAVSALIAALNEFEGGVVVVSHDTHLISCVADEIYHVDPAQHTVTQYKDTIEQYRKDLLKRKL
ncbi:uncharacterized protein LOC129617043 [Condylostylus longicornis]|uniref:uncharacterized protein LOC129617043 n=1 Tax=Condylostylus longicornis TaxID=2530218 RepID=UPI00244DBC09|nr:uncharacterized protein LOC129617043 [Condylostylus longicornis]